MVQKICVENNCHKNIYLDDMCKFHYKEKNKGLIKLDENNILVKFCHQNSCLKYKLESGFRKKNGDASETCAECLKKSKLKEANRNRDRGDRSDEYKTYNANDAVKERKKQWDRENRGKSKKPE